MLDEKDMLDETDGRHGRSRRLGAARRRGRDPARLRRAGDRGDPRARRRPAARAGRRAARIRHRRPDRGARRRAAPAADRADGLRLRLHGADRSRRHGARGDPRGARDRDRGRGRPRARFRRCRLHPGRPAEGRAGGNPGATAAARARRARAPPRLPGSLGRAAHADRVHRGAAGVDRRADHRLHARDRGSARALLRDLRDRCGRQVPRRGAARPADALEAPGARCPR